MTVVVSEIGFKDGLKVVAPKMRVRSRHSRRSVPTNRSANAIASGARIGVRTILRLSERNTSSEPATYLQSRLRMSKRKGRPSHRATRLRACWVPQEASGMEVTPPTVDPSGSDLDEEQRIETTQEHRVHGHKVAR
jgi:hypothetical protein